MNQSLIDTDILSEFFRGNDKVNSNMKKYLNEYENLNISKITYYEILNGLLYKDAKKQLKKFETFISLNNIILMTLESTKIAANIQADLRKKGKEIGHTDNLIAGIALTNEFELVTNNFEHFKRVKGLKLLNWLN